MRLPALLFSLAAAASAQIASTPTAMRDPTMRRPVTGMPCSAQQVTEHVQVLADGTRLTQTREKLTLYRDSEGRTRTEHIPTQNPGSAPATPRAVGLIEIIDPVASVRYVLEPRTHVFTQSAFSPPPPPPPPPSSPNGTSALFVRPARPGFVQTGAQPPDQGAQRPQLTRESLGTRTIEGVAATGTRTTTVYPVGFAGNDRPFSTSNEIWTSPELNMTVLEINSDPRSGDTTTALTNISRAEPDPSLFRVPPDYQAVAPIESVH